MQRMTFSDLWEVYRETSHVKNQISLLRGRQHTSWSRYTTPEADILSSVFREIDNVPLKWTYILLLDILKKNRHTGFRVRITVRAFFKAEPTVAFYCQYQRRSLAGLADKHIAYLTLSYYGIPNIKLFWYKRESYIILLYKTI